MCLIVFAFRSTPEYPLIVAANRDEFYQRPTEAAHFWPDHPQVLAGRDQQQGGTWLGMTRNGRFAAVTNVRRPIQATLQSTPQSALESTPQSRSSMRSRGELTREFLTGEQPPAQYLENIQRRAAEYNSFNLLLGTPEQLFHFHSDGDPQQLTPGVYAISNANLDTGWPKLKGAKQDFQQAVDLVAENGAEPQAEVLLDIMANRQQPPDHELPNTGIGLEKERLLSSRFIVSTDYGTRSTSLLTLANNGQVKFLEQSFNEGEPGQRVSFDFSLER